MDPYQAAAAEMLGVSGADVQPHYVGGADVSPRYMPRGSVGAPALAVPSVNQGQVVNYSGVQYVAGDVSYFGLGRTAIPANDRVVIPAIRPTRPFKPQKLFIPSTIQDLLLENADIGGTNMFADQSGVPVEIFSEVSTSPQLDWLTIEPAVGIILTVSNPTAVDAVFSGALYGTQVRR